MSDVKWSNPIETRPNPENDAFLAADCCTSSETEPCSNHDPKPDTCDNDELMVTYAIVFSIMEFAKSRLF
jgi:hypothetical protein